MGVVYTYKSSRIHVQLGWGENAGFLLFAKDCIVTLSEIAWRGSSRQVEGSCMAAAAAGAAAAFGGASWLLQAAAASSLLFVCQTASEQANKQRTGLK